MKELIWHQRWLRMANEVSTWSKDPSTQTGAVIVNSENDFIQLGCNGFPRGIVDSDERFNNRELKYKIIKHAEENALDNCARVGVSTKECIMYVTHFPCIGCAGGIIQAGITTIVMSTIPVSVGFTERWKDDVELTRQILNEANIIIKEV